MKREQVYVLVDTEPKSLLSKEILSRYKEEYHNFLINNYWKYLAFDKPSNKWDLYRVVPENKTEISLDELEEMLGGGKKNSAPEDLFLDLEKYDHFGFYEHKYKCELYSRDEVVVLIKEYADQQTSELRKQLEEIKYNLECVLEATEELHTMAVVKGSIDNINKLLNPQQP